MEAFYYMSIIYEWKLGESNTFIAKNKFSNP